MAGLVTVGLLPVSAAADSTDLARGKSVTVGGSHGGFPAVNANDGQVSTYWESSSAGRRHTAAVRRVARAARPDLPGGHQVPLRLQRDAGENAAFHIIDLIEPGSQFTITGSPNGARAER